MSVARLRAAALVTGALVTGGVAPADAGDNDLVLARLSSLVGTGENQRGVGQSLELRSLVSELGVALAPRLLTPADTLGFGGFQLSADLASTTITGDAPYWRVLRSSTGPTETGTFDHGTSSLPTVGVFVRKGMWFPLPSIEFGGGAVHLIDSRLWTGQGYVKLAVHEGYHDLPIPSIAVRGGVSRLFGQKELDLTIASFDASISKHVGVAGTWSIDPYAGWNMLLMVPRSEVIDPTPNVDSLDEVANPGDRNLDFVFKDQDDITRQRFFVGAKMQYYVFQLTVEATFARAGTSVDDRAGDTPCMPASTTTACDATDQARSQRTLTVSGGFDF